MKMRNIIKTLALALLVVNVSCENDDQATISGEGTAPQLIAPSANAEYVLDYMHPSSQAMTLVWNHADYNVQTGVTYEVEFAKSGTDFAEVISGGTSDNNQKFKNFTMLELNNIAKQALLAPFTMGKLDVRVKSSLGSNGETGVMYSNPLTLNITPYSTDLPKLAIIGNHNGNSFDNPPTIASSAYGTNTDYEGYVWLDGAFKIYAPNQVGDFVSGGTVYGDDGSFSGTLGEGGESITASAGYYRIKVNLTANTYTVEPANWGIVGNATPGGWDASTPMVYDQATRTWSVTATMSAQNAPNDGWKFRANNAWDINLGDAVTNETDGKLSYGGSNIGIATAGTYKIVLDLSNPRAYKYSIAPAQ
jgi:starch-binding outer membrane protein SusE/F